MTHLQRMQEGLRALEVDGAIISSPINQRYLSGFPFADGYLLITQTNAYLLTDFRYLEAAQKAVPHMTVLCAKSTMFTELRRLIGEEGLERVALEDAHLSCADFRRFSKELNGCSLTTGASELLSDLRMVKTDEELEKIAQAQAVTDLAFDHILGVISPDLTEKDISLELEFFMRKHGADGVAFETIAVSGPSSALPHGVPSDTKLRQGFLTMDFGAMINGYCSDMTRTVVIGKADADMKRLYQTVLSAQTAALEQIAEGMSCRQADRIARQIIEDAGYGDCFGHSLGHGVGMYIHEAPRLSSAAPENAVLKRGHVVTVEPGIYLSGRYGCRIEDMIAVTHEGTIRNFTKSPKHLIEL